MKSDNRVLITGGTGFIGGRVVEAMHLSGFRKPVVGLRRWASAPRIARFPVEMVFCDVMNLDQLRAAMKGVSAVIHCAVGGPSVNVEGTRNVLAAAVDEGLQRIVHLSTVEVYGPVWGEIDESWPLQRSGSPYADSKFEAEHICKEYISQGAPVVILRPPIVYGPFSDLWTVRVAERLFAGAYRLAWDEDDGICNLIYIDDLVRAIFLALAQPDAVGNAFNINGPERLTWNEYLDRFAGALGLAPLQQGVNSKARLRAHLMHYIRSTAKLVLERFQPQIMKLYAEYNLAKHLMKYTQQALRLTPTPAELGLYRRKAFYIAEKARHQLGYEPRYSLDRGLQLSIDWLKHHQLPGLAYS